MQIVDDIFQFIKENPKKVLLILVIGILGYFISNYMTKKSVVYSEGPFKDYGGKIVSENIAYEFNKSSTLSESVSIGSLMFSSLNLNENITLTKDVYDAIEQLDAASGKAGNLMIPAGATSISEFNIHLYSWKKQYKYFFNQFEHSEIEIVFVIENSALRGKLASSGLGMLSEVSIYELNP